MFNWAKNALGVTEPVYGPTAIQSVAEQGKQPYTEFGKDVLAWERMDSTNVETKSFYLVSDSGKVGLVQVLYSNVMGIRTTAQISCKVFSSEPGKPHLWFSDNLNHFEFSADNYSFSANSNAVSLTLSEDGETYTIKSNVNPKCIIDLRISKLAPGFVAGKDGVSTFGTDPTKPWGRMKHAFWPRCRVEGSIMTQSGPIDFNGRGMLSSALQGIKPHFAAQKWNFVNFQSPSYSAIMMEFTTPKSYGETVVNVGGLAIDGQIVFGGASPATTATHTAVKGDPDNDWPEPSAAKFTWQGKTKDGKDVQVELAGDLGTRADRVDVMGELPKFVKQIASSASGTKPYIYQFVPKLKIKVIIDGETKEEEGQLFMEATFIS